MSPLAFLVCALAAHRLIVLWLNDLITQPFRQPLQARGGWLGYFASCPSCVSFWAGLIAAGLWASGLVGQVIVTGLAASSGALVLNVLIQRTERVG